MAAPFLTEEQQQTMAEYVELRERALEEGWHYWCRLDDSFETVDHCIAWVDPFDLDAPIRVAHPSPTFIGQLMKGGIHPPVAAHHNAQILLVSKSGDYRVVKQVDAPRARHEMKPILAELVVDYTDVHTQVMGALSYEDSIQYCLKKDVPVDVWGSDVARNRCMYSVIRRSDLPQERHNRQLWRLDEQGAIAV